MSILYLSEHLAESLASVFSSNETDVSSGPNLPAASLFNDASIDLVVDVSKDDFVSIADSSSILESLPVSSLSEDLPVIALEPRGFEKWFIGDSFSKHLPSLSGTRREFIDHSVVAHLDGLIHAVFRVRLEHDICVRFEEVSYCKCFGRSYSPMSSFVALVFPCDNWLTRLCVLQCAMQKGTALFIVREAPLEGAPLPQEFGGLSWFRTLESRSVLRFSFSGDYCRYGEMFPPTKPYPSKVP